MRKHVFAGTAALTMTLLAGSALADDKVYAGFPITVKGYAGDKTTSVAYSGQIGRQALHDSLKKLAGKGNGAANEELLAALNLYYSGKGEDREILAPASKGAFVIKQKTIGEISDTNLSGKTYGGTITGMPNNRTGEELVNFWIEKAAASEGGADLVNGYDYPQLISKFIMGAVFYNQAVDGYLDENLSAEKKPNDQPYSEGAAYTGKDHSWDEAFGYFGAPAHALTLTPAQVYDIAKMKEEAFALADYNKDGVVDLKTEMVFGPAYYAAGADKSSAGKENATNYLHTIVQAFLDGRKLLVAANGEKLTDAQRTELRGYAAVISDNWEKVLAEAVFKYAGSVYKDLTKLKAVVESGGNEAEVLGDYVKHWGELKGFSLALQTGKDNLGETAVRLNRLIGFGPLLPNASQVVDIDSDGNYLRDQGPSFGEYMLHMLKVQKLMVDSFGIKAQDNNVMGDMADLSNALGGGSSAEND